MLKCLAERAWAGGRRGGLLCRGDAPLRNFRHRLRRVLSHFARLAQSGDNSRLSPLKRCLAMTHILYHNPRCSKSRDTLALLQAQGISPTIVAYLDTPPDAATLRSLLAKLGMQDARALMRQGEAEYQALNLADPTLSQDALIAAMQAHPRLIERPILVHGDQAVIGRPPERVREIW